MLALTHSQYYSIAKWSSRSAQTLSSRRRSVIRRSRLPGTCAAYRKATDIRQGQRRRGRPDLRAVAHRFVVSTTMRSYSSFHVSSAQLKINLRPVWSPAAEALRELSDRFDSEVWNILFQELQWSMRSSNSVAAPSNPDWMSSIAREDDVWEEERSWRDPSAHKIRTTTIQWMSDSSSRDTIVQVADVQNT